MKVNETKDGAVVKTSFYTVKLLRRGGRIVSLVRAGGDELVWYPGPIHVYCPGGIAKEVECGCPGEMARDLFRQEILPAHDGTVRIRYTYQGKPGFFIGWAMAQVKTFVFRADSPLIGVENSLYNVGAPEQVAEFRIHNDVMAGDESVTLIPTTQGMREIPASETAAHFIADFTEGLAGIWHRGAGEALFFLPDYDAVAKFLYSPGKGAATIEWYYRSFSIGNGAVWTARYGILPIALTALDDLPATLAAVGVPLTLGRERRPQADVEARQGSAKPPEQNTAMAEFSRTVTANLARETAFASPDIVACPALPGGTLCSRAIHTRSGCGMEATLPEDSDIVLTADAWWKEAGPGGTEAYIGCCDPEGNLCAVSSVAKLNFWNQSATITLSVNEWAGKSVRLFLYGQDVHWTSVRLTSQSGSGRGLFSALRVQTPGSDEPMETTADGHVPLDFVVVSPEAPPRIEYRIADAAKSSKKPNVLKMKQTPGEPGRYVARLVVVANQEIAYRVVAGSESVEGNAYRSGHLPAQGLPKGVIRLYVSPTGNDAFTGRMPAPNAKRTDGPFATLRRAQAAVRKLTKGGKPSAPVAVIIRAGTYEMDKPLTFAPEDSGSADCPILWTAAPGETVVVSGGRRLTGTWTPAGNGVYTCRLTGFGKKTPMFREFFVNGKRMPRARWPLSGYFKLGIYTDSSRQRMRFTPSDLRDVRGLKDADFVLHFVWNETRFRLAHMDAEKGVLALRAPLYPNAPQDRYYVENVPAGLAAEDAWHFDPHTTLLSWHPSPGVDPAKAETVVPRLSELVRFRGRSGKPVRHIGLRGLKFANSDWFELDSGPQSASRVGAAVSLENAEFCCLRNNRITNVGTYGISLNKGSRRIAIVENEIAFAGAGGVRIGLMEQDKTTRQNIVVGNDIHDCGRVYPSAIGVWIGQSSDNLLCGNHIYRMPYTGISVGWTWGPGANTHARNRIERNKVHDVMQLFHDGSAIYLLGISYGTTVRDNIISDTGTGNGIYLDEGSTGMRISGNVVCRCPAGLVLHGARDNLFENNVVADIRGGFVVLSNCQSYMTDNRFRRNIFYSNSDAPLIAANGWTRRFVIESGENLYFHADGKPFRIEGVPGITTLEDWIAAGYETKPRLEAPRFVDPANGDYRILPAAEKCR